MEAPQPRRGVKHRPQPKHGREPIPVPAGQVIKELAPLVGGKGGGKPDMAEGGGNHPEKLGEALEASYAVIERLVSGAS